jgi:hypothetical protein
LGGRLTWAIVKLGQTKNKKIMEWRIRESITKGEKGELKSGHEGKSFFLDIGAQ